MVTTRSKTNSLPAKRATTPDHDNAPIRKKQRKAPTKPKVKAPKKSTASESASKAKQTTLTATFFDLPAELRNYIYSMVLVNHIPPPCTKVDPKFPPPGLLSINRQIRNEALTMYSSEMVIHIQGSAPAVKCLRGLKPGKLHDVREVCIISNEPATVPYAVQRTRQLLREFGDAGLRDNAVRFFVDYGKRKEWACLYHLELVEHEYGKKTPRRNQTPATTTSAFKGQGRLLGG